MSQQLQINDKFTYVGVVSIVSSGIQKRFHNNGTTKLFNLLRDVLLAREFDEKRLPAYIMLYAVKKGDEGEFETAVKNGSLPSPGDDGITECLYTEATIDRYEQTPEVNDTTVLSIAQYRTLMVKSQLNSNVNERDNTYYLGLIAANRNDMLAYVKVDSKTPLGGEQTLITWDLKLGNMIDKVSTTPTTGGQTITTGENT